MNFWVKLSAFQQKLYDTLKAAVLDELVIAKLGFFSCLAGMCKPFLTVYQTDRPMIPFLYGDLFKLFF